MKKLLLAGGALLLLAGVAVAGLGVYLASRLQTPELERSLLDQAKATLGTELRGARTWRSRSSPGSTLEGIAVANPAPFRGQLLTADAFVLRYRLLPLLAGRVQVDRLALEKPVLALAMDAKGGFNYEKLGGAAAKGAPAASGQAAPAAAAPLRIVMKSLAVENGSIRDERLREGAADGRRGHRLPERLRGRGRRRRRARARSRSGRPTSPTCCSCAASRRRSRCRRRR